MVVIEFSGQVLVLSEASFEEARLRGLELMPTAPADTAATEILDASGMEDRTKIPASWWLESSRRGTVPYLKFGKYVRFVLSEALAAAKEKR